MSFLRERLRKIKLLKLIYTKLYGIKWDYNQRAANRAVTTWALDKVAEIQASFEEAGLQSILVYGSLLGIVREGKFIEHDDDVDLAVIYEGQPDFWETVENIMESHGFHRSAEYYADQQKEKLTELAFKRKHLSMDIFAFTKADQGYLAYFYYKKDSVTYPTPDAVSTGLGHHTQITGFTTVEIDGQTLYIPENPELVVEEMYGKGWKIPDPDWNDEGSKAYEFLDTTFGTKVHCE